MKTKTTKRRSGKFSWLLAALPGLLILQITGCANMPEGSPVMQQQALSFSPPPGKAGVYVIRPGDIGWAGVLFQLSFDYQEYGSMEGGSYIFGTVTPGEHTVRCYTPNESSGVTHFTAEAGKNYYFHAYHRDDGLISLLSTARHYTFLMEPISEKIGHAIVRKFKLSGDNRFQYQNQPPPAQ